MNKLLLLLLLLPVFAYASGGDCDHPRFVEIGCEQPGPPGPPGEQGPIGPQGPPGEIPEDWLTEVTNNYYNMRNEYQDLTAAQAALLAPLPQEFDSRLTFNVSQVAGSTGFGAGYAYRLKDDQNTALTIAVGTSGGETAIQGSVGFGFGKRGQSIEDTLIAKELETLKREVAALKACEPDTCAFVDGVLYHYREEE